MTNLKENVQAIQLRRKKQLENLHVEECKSKAKVFHKGAEESKHESDDQVIVVSSAKIDMEKALEHVNTKPYEPPISYPTQLKTKYAKKENQFFKFVKVFKRLDINILFCKCFSINAQLYKIHEGDK